jgi:hypothetical protein
MRFPPLPFATGEGPAEALTWDLPIDQGPIDARNRCA